MAELAGNAHISLEGHRSHGQFIDGLVLTRDETQMLKRDTLAPTHDFIVLRLANETNVSRSNTRRLRSRADLQADPGGRFKTRNSPRAD
jgi:hypothetical protein